MSDDVYLPPIVAEIIADPSKFAAGIGAADAEIDSFDETVTASMAKMVDSMQTSFELMGGEAEAFAADMQMTLGDIPAAMSNGLTVAEAKMAAAEEGMSAESMGFAGKMKAAFASVAASIGGLSLPFSGARSAAQDAEEGMEDDSKLFGGKLSGVFNGLMGTLGLLGVPLENATTKMHEMGEGAETLGADTENATASMGEFASFGLLAVGAAILGVIGESAKLAINMQQTDAAIAAASGTSVNAAAAITDAFATTALTTGESANSMGQAFAAVAGQLKQVNGSALDAGQALAFMNATALLADASGQDLGEVTSATAKILQAFKLSVSDASDVTNALYSASVATGTSISNLASQLIKLETKVGPLGGSVQDLTGFVVDMTNQGISGRGALSLLNTSLDQLMKTTTSTVPTTAQLNGVLSQMSPTVRALAEGYQKGTVSAAQLAAAEKGTSAASVGLTNTSKALTDQIGQQEAALTSATQSQTDAYNKLSPALQALATQYKDGKLTLQQFQAAALKAQALANIKVAVTGQQDVTAFKNSISALTSQIGTLAQKSAAAWATAQQQQIDSTYNAQVAAINNGAQAQQLATLQAQQAQAQAAQQTASDQQALADANAQYSQAVAGGDPQAISDAQAAQQAAQAQITSDQNQAQQTQLQQSINAQLAAASSQKTASESAAQQQEDAYQAQMTAQGNMLTQELATNKISYSQYVTDVNKMLGQVSGTSVTMTASSTTAKTITLFEEGAKAAAKTNTSFNAAAVSAKTLAAAEKGGLNPATMSLLDSFASASNRVRALSTSLTENKTRQANLTNEIGQQTQATAPLAASQVALLQNYKKMADASLQAKLGLDKMTPAQAELKRLGVSVYNAKGQFIGLAAVVEKLAPKYAKMSAAQQQYASDQLFGANAGKEMTRVIDAGAGALQRATDLTANHGQVATAAAKQLSTFTGGWRILKATGADLGDTLGKGILPVLGVVMEALASFTRSVIDMGTWLGVAAYNVYSFGDTVVGVFKTLFNWFGSTWKKVSGLVEAPFTAIEQGFTGFKAAMVDIANSIVQSFAGAFSGLASQIGSVISGVPGAIGSVSSGFVNIGSSMVSWIVSGFTGLAKDIGNIISGVPSAIGSLIGDFTTLGGQVVTGILGGMSGIGSDIWNLIVSGIGDVGNIGSTIANAIISGLSSAGGSFISIGGSIISGIVSGMGSLGSDILNIFSSLPSTIGGAIESEFSGPTGKAIEQGMIGAMTALPGDVLKLIESIPGALGSAASTIGGIGASLASWIVNGIGNLAGTAGTYIGTQFQNIPSHISSAAKGVGKTIGGLLSSAPGAAVHALGNFGTIISTWFGKGLSYMEGKMSGIIKSLGNLTSGLGSGIASAVTGIVQGALNGMVGILNDIIGVIDGFIKTWDKLHLPSWVPGIGGDGLPNIGQIGKIAPVKLAEGGIVTSPTYALIGEAGPEAVIPLSQINNQNGGKGGGLHIDALNVYQATASSTQLVQDLYFKLRPLLTAS